MGSDRKLKIGGNVSVKVSEEGRRVVVFVLLMLIVHLFLVGNIKRGFRKQIYSTKHSFICKISA